jgi:hypothetical protein
MKTSRNENIKPAGETFASPGWMQSTIAKLEKELASKYGESQGARIKRG